MCREPQDSGRDEKRNRSQKPTRKPLSSHHCVKMPGRTTTRNTTAPRNKSPARTLTSRSKTTSPTTIERQDQNLSSLRSQICSILSDAQKTTVGQRKLVVGLRKIQEVCCYEPTQHRQSTRKNFCEDDFNEEITRCVIRLMVVKRSEAVGDRLIGFLGVFLRYANDKGQD